MKSFHFRKSATWYVVVLIGIVFFSLIRYGLESHHDFQKNSLPYLLLLDSEVANIPVGAQQAMIRFSTRSQDGTAPSMNAATITAPNLGAARVAAIDYLKQRGYVEQTVCEPACAAIWIKDDASYNIYTEGSKLMVVKTKLTSK